MTVTERISAVLRALEYTPKRIAEGVHCSYERAEALLNGDVRIIYLDEFMTLCDFLKVRPGLFIDVSGGFRMSLE